MQPTAYLLMVMMEILDEKCMDFYATLSYGHWKDKFFSQNNIYGLVQERLQCVSNGVMSFLH